MDTESFKSIINNYIKGSRKVLLIGPMALKRQGLELLNQSKLPIIFVDGGLKHRNEGQAKCLSIGDGDSGGECCDINFPIQKDFSDLEGVLRYLPKTVCEVVALGFQGGRLDHELVVLNNFYRHAELNNCKVENMGPRRIEIYPSGCHEVSIFGGFSLLSQKECSVTLSGDCKYHGENILLPTFGGRGLSNEGLGKIKLTTDAPIGIFLFDS